MTDYPRIGMVKSHVTRFLYFAFNHIFGIGKARHFKLRVLIDAQEYCCMHIILSLKQMCLESRDLFKFWATSDNISLTVQYTDIVAMEHQ